MDSEQIERIRILAGRILYRRFTCAIEEGLDKITLTVESDGVGKLVWESDIFDSNTSVYNYQGESIGILSSSEGELGEYLNDLMRIIERSYYLGSCQPSPTSKVNAFKKRFSRFFEDLIEAFFGLFTGSYRDGKE